MKYINNKFFENENKIIEIIKNTFGIKQENKILIDKYFCDTIKNHELFNTINIEQINKEDLYIRLFAYAIDDFNLDLLDYLISINIKKKARNIIFDLYKKNYLNSDGLEFILYYRNNSIYISSYLIKILIQQDNIKLLDILFKYSKFFDNETILNFCYLSKYKNALSSSELQNIISDEKFKIKKNNNDKYLFYAIKTRNEFIVRYLIEHGVDINQQDDIDITTPLIASFSYKNNAIIEYLIKNGADINQTDSSGNSPLILASSNNDEDIIKYLIEHGANVNQKDNSGNTPLIIACQHKNENMVKYLVECGALVNMENNSNNTALTIACMNGHERIIKHLVDQGANVNQKNNIHDTPLIFACRNRNEKIVRYLVEHGAIVNHVNLDDETPLTVACQYGNKRIIKYLIECGADKSRCKYPFIPDLIVGGEDEKEYTKNHLIQQENISDNNELLIKACTFGNEMIVKYLIEHEHYDNIQYNDYYNLLYVACQNDHNTIIKYLVEFLKNLNVPYINLPLIQACENENEEIIKYFVENGACVCPDILMHQCKKRNEKIIKYLIDHFNFREFNNDDLLMISCEKGYLYVLRRLFDHGVFVNQKIYQFYKYCGKSTTPLICA
eukprot:jgi/Orpsp1_1/1189535/evm.model.d7180000072697.1